MHREAANVRTLGKILVAGVAGAVGVGLVAGVLAQALDGSPAVASKETVLVFKGFAVLSVWALGALWILHLIWVHAAVSCAHAIGRRAPKLPTPGLAVFAYFIPIVCLYWPFIHMRALRTASDLRDLELRGAAKRRAATTMRDEKPQRAPVGLWWLSFNHVVGSFAGYLVASSQLVLASVVEAAMALLWIDVVRRISGGLVERARLIDLGAVSAFDGSDEEDDDADDGKRKKVRKPRRLREMG